MVFQIITGKSQSCCVFGKLFESILNNRLSFKNEVCIMIMIHIKLDSKAVRELRTIYSYYVPS